MQNLGQYFKDEHQIYLNGINFEKFDVIPQPKNGEITLNCTDNIAATVKDNEGVEIILTRKLTFVPEQLFGLVISFGADLKFDKEKAKEINWREINLADEFRDNGDFIISNLLSRISLLVAQITSSFGQTPLIIPPSMPKTQKSKPVK